MAKANLAQERQEREESDQLAGMVADTEDEIAKYAFSQQEDENDGDHSLEEPEDPTGVEDAEEGDSDEPDASEGDESDGEPEVEAGEQRDEPDERGVPSWRLREETERRERLERELDSYRQQRYTQPAPQPAPQPQVPDMFADPEGYTKYIRETAASDALTKFRNDHSQRSYTAARENNPAEFDYAYKLAEERRGDPLFQRDLARIEAAYDPGQAFMQWAEPHLAEFRERQAQERHERFAEDFGVDVDTFQRALAMVSKGSGRPVSNRRPNMPSLNESGGNARSRERMDPRGMDGSERAIFEDVFSTR